MQEDDDLHAVLDELQARDFINAGRVAESVVNRRAARLGTQRVVQELRAKGLDDALVRETAERLRGTESARALAVWRQRFGTPPETPRSGHARCVSSRLAASRATWCGAWSAAAWRPTTTCRNEEATMWSTRQPRTGSRG